MLLANGAMHPGRPGHAAVRGRPPGPPGVAGLCIAGISRRLPHHLLRLYLLLLRRQVLLLNFSVMNFNLTGASFVATTAASVLLTQIKVRRPAGAAAGARCMAALALNFSIKRP